MCDELEEFGNIDRLIYISTFLERNKKYKGGHIKEN